MKIPAAFLLSLLSSTALAQNINPSPGNIWTYYGPTLGSGWGTLAGVQLPFPSSSTLGGVKSLTPSISGQFLNSLDNTGTFTRATALIPSNNLSDLASTTIAANNLLGNTTAHTYYARAYGNCTWAVDGTGDNSACILAAITAAKANVTIGGDFFRNGGATVILPEGNIGVAATILQNTAPGIIIRGAGGPGSFGYCKTSLTWTGAAGGTVIKNELTIGGGLEGLCIKGNTTTAGTGASIGIQLRSSTNATYRDVYVQNVQSKAWDLDVDSANTRGLSNNNFYDVPVTLNTTGAINASCWDIGPGSATNDTWGNQWMRAVCQHQNGVGWKIANTDTNFFHHIWAQPILGGTGKGVQLLGSAAGPFNLSEARANVFSGVFLSGFYAETNTFPSFNNYVTILGRGSGAPLPVIAAGATLGYETDDGIRFDNRSGATTLTHGGMSYKATPGANNAVFDIDTANASNAATVGKFGPTLPIYLLYNNPTVGFNLYWKGGGNFAYGKGSSASYGGSLNYAGNTGTFTFSGTTATGNADDTAALTNFATLERTGNFTLLPGGALLTAPSAKVTGNMTVGSTATPGANNAIFDVDAVTSFATAAKFGPSLPTYLMAGSPVVGFNAYWNTGAWKYGKGSSGNYGGTLSYGATTGTFTFSGTTATGNANDTATLTNFATLERTGNFGLLGHLLLENTKQYQSKDSGGTTRALLSMFSDNKTYLDGGAGGIAIRTNNAAATVGSTTGTSANFTFNNPVILGSGYTVASLPAGTVGMRTYVTDQTTACPATGAVLTGGGAIVCPAFYNGAAWVGG